MSTSAYTVSYSRKQAGVVYRAIKEGKLEMSKDAVSLMYDLADEERYDGSDVIPTFINNIKAMVECIFSGDMAEAQKIADEVSEGR